jgi:cytochrome c551/c552
MRMIARNHARQAWLVFVLSLILFGLFLNRGMSMQANANQEHAFLMSARAAEMRNELLDAREALYASSQEVDPLLGERIYKERCTACHVFDRKLVGPPYNDVLPKYGDRLDDLAGFIRNPQRVDSSYPPMPDQGLRRVEARAVAEYLLRQFGVDLPEPEVEAEEGGAH